VPASSANSEDTLSRFLKEIDWFEVQKLSFEHDFSGFNCGGGKEDNELDSFLKENALSEQGENANVTYAAVLKGAKIVIGYVTILNDKLRVSTKEKKDMRIASGYHDFPAIKIGRLAVDKRHVGKKVATTLLQGIIGLALETAEKTGCRFLIVDSYPKSVDWYLKKSFVKNLIQGQRKTKVIKENSDGSITTDSDYQRETVSLRFDLLNPK